MIEEPTLIEPAAHICTCCVSLCISLPIKHRFCCISCRGKRLVPLHTIRRKVRNLSSSLLIVQVAVITGGGTCWLSLLLRSICWISDNESHTNMHSASSSAVCLPAQTAALDYLLRFILQRKVSLSLWRGLVIDCVLVLGKRQVC